MRKFILFAILLLVSHSALSGGVLLKWNAPTTRTDGTPLKTSDLQIYEITFVTALDTVGLAVLLPTYTSFMATFPAGTVIQSTDQFRIRVRDTGGLWSAYSTMSLPATYTVPATTPSYPIFTNCTK